MTVFDWLGRVVMLALAGMVTLSIIGAIAAIPNGIVPQQLGIERAQLPTPETRVEHGPTPSAPEIDPGNSVESTVGTGGVNDTILAPAPPEPVDPALWLETISYALLALVGLAALACLLLWRGVRQQRRIADALEALSSVPLANSAPPS